MLITENDTRGEKRRLIMQAQAVLARRKEELREYKSNVKIGEQRVLDAMKELDKLVLKPPTRDRKGRMVYKD